MKKKILALLVITSLVIGLASCKEEDYRKGYVFSSMGSVIEVQIYEENDKVFEAVKDIFDYYGQLTSNYKRNEVEEDSPYYNLNNIFVINDKAGIEPVTVNEDLIDLLELSIELNEETHGYFNIGTGKISEIWKDVIKPNIFVTKERYQQTLNILESYDTPDLSKIIIDKENSTVYLEDDSFLIDLGAIAKGYATELAYNYVKNELGVKRFKINGGSSSIAIGLPPIGHKMKTFIKDDNSTYTTDFYKDGVLGYIKDGNKHITTSGSGQQYVNVIDDNGKAYTKIHHIISPFTLAPVNNYFKVTLVGNNSTLLDAYSTAVFLMSLEDAVNFLEEHNIGYILYLNDYSLVTNLSQDVFVPYEIVGEIK